MPIHKNGLDSPSCHYYQNEISQKPFDNDEVSKYDNERLSAQHNDYTHSATLVTPRSSPFWMDAPTELGLYRATYQSDTSFPRCRYLFSPRKDTETSAEAPKHQPDETFLPDSNQSRSCASIKESGNAFFTSIKKCRDELQFKKGLNCNKKYAKWGEINESSLDLTASQLYTLKHSKTLTSVCGKAEESVLTQRSALHTPQHSSGSSPIILSPERQYPLKENSNREEEHIPQETFRQKHTVFGVFTPGRVLSVKSKDTERKREGDRKEIRPSVPYATSFVHETQHGRSKNSDCPFNRLSVDSPSGNIDTTLSSSYYISHAAVSPTSPSIKKFIDSAPSHFLDGKSKYLGELSSIRSDTILAGKSYDFSCDGEPGKKTRIRKATAIGNEARLQTDDGELNLLHIPQKSDSLDKSVENAHDSSSLILLTDYLCRKVRSLENENAALRQFVLHSSDLYRETITSFPSRKDQLDCEDSPQIAKCCQHSTSQSPCVIQSSPELERAKVVAHRKGSSAEITENNTSKDQNGICAKGVALFPSLSRQDEGASACKEITSCVSKISRDECEKGQSTRFQQRSPVFQEVSTGRMTSAPTDLHSRLCIHNENGNVDSDVPNLNPGYNSVSISWEDTKKSVHALNASYAAQDPYKRHVSASDMSWRHDLEGQGPFLGDAGAAEACDDYDITRDGIAKDEAGPDCKDHITLSLHHLLPCSTSNGAQPHSKHTHKDVSRLNAYYNYLKATHQYLLGLHNTILSTSKKLQRISSSTPLQRNLFPSNRDICFKASKDSQEFNKFPASDIKPEFPRSKADGISIHTLNTDVRNSRVSPHYTPQNPPYSLPVRNKSCICAKSSNDHSVCDYGLSSSTVPNILRRRFSGIMQPELSATATRLTTRRGDKDSRSSTHPVFRLCPNAREAHWKPQTEVSRNFQALPTEGTKATPMFLHVENNEACVFGNKRGTSSQKNFACSSCVKNMPVGVNNADTMELDGCCSFWGGSKPEAYQRLMTTPSGPATYSSQDATTGSTSEYTGGFRNASDNGYTKNMVSLVDQNKKKTNSRDRFQVPSRLRNQTPPSSKSHIDSGSDPYSFSLSVDTAKVYARKKKANGKVVST